MKQSVRSIAAFTFLSILLFVAASAQITTGTISGVVKDETGAVLPGVTVTVTSNETGAKRTAITDDSGYYKAPQLAVGLYQVEAELSGFSTAAITGRSSAPVFSIRRASP